MTRSQGGRWVSIAALVSVATSVPALAANPWFAWSAPPDCPSSDAVLARIRAAAQSDAPEDFTARAVIESAGDRYSGRVQVTSGEARSERTFEGDSCATVADAVALTVSLSIAPSRGLSASQGLPASQGPSASQGLAAVAAVPARSLIARIALAAAPVQASTANVTTSAAPEVGSANVTTTAAADGAPAADSAPSPHSRSPDTLLVNAAAIVDTGGVPSLSPGVAVGVAWRRAPVEIGVGVTSVEGECATVPGSTSGASVSLAAASAGVCLVVPIGDRIVAGPCAGGAVERLSANGFGPSGAFASSQPVVVTPAAFGEAELEWSPTSVLAVRASARAMAPLSRPQFVVQGPGGGNAYRPAPVDLEPSLGVVVRFGK
jgi:hypothetical protein